MKTYIFTKLLVCGLIACQAQTKETVVDTEMYVPVEIFIPDDGWISWNTPFGLKSERDLWFKVMKYDMTNPREAYDLHQKDPEAYRKKNSQILFSRKECEFIVTDYVRRLSIMARDTAHRRIIIGKGIHKAKEDNLAAYRCVCVPAKDLVEMRHGENNAYRPTFYLDPEDFVKKFHRYGLDTLTRSELPYYTIFPKDIDPSFDCSKATTFVEKTICRDIDLSKLDKELSDLYQIYLFKYGNSAKESQRLWSTQREEKTQGQTHERAVQILKELYSKRILELRNSK